MTPLSRIGFLVAAVAIVVWLVWLTSALMDLRDWGETVGPDIDEAVDKVNGVINHLHETEPVTGRHADRRFSFGEDDGANIALIRPLPVPGVHGHADGTDEGSTGRTGQGNDAQ